MKNSFYFFFMLGSTLFFWGCGAERDCKPGGINIAFIGFDLSASDTIRIRSFVPNTNFGQIADEKMFVIQETYNYGTRLKGDTIILSRANHYDPDFGILEAGHDWEIIAGNRVHRIDDFKTQTRTKKCGGILSLDCFDCSSPVTEYNFDGIPKTITSENFVYLAK